MNTLTEVEPVSTDMLALFERAFNPQLCEELATKAEQNLATYTTVQLNGVYRQFRGTSVCLANILALQKRDWCSATYKVYYTEPGVEGEKELRPGVTIRLQDGMAFTVRRDDADDWAREETERRFIRDRMKRLGM